MKALVGVIMGSTSDLETMDCACKILAELNIPYEKRSYPRTALRNIWWNTQKQPQIAA